MIRIDVAIDKNDGSQAAANSVIDAKYMIAPETLTLTFLAAYYVSAATFAAADSPIVDLSDLPSKFAQTLDAGDWLTLMTSANFKIAVELELQNLIEAVVGVGNTTII